MQSLMNALAAFNGDPLSTFDGDPIVDVAVIVICALLLLYALVLGAVHRHGRYGKADDAQADAAWMADHLRDTTASTGRRIK